MLINETLKTFVPTIKPQEAKTFYQDILELKLLNEDSYGIEFDSGGTLLRVITVRELKPHEFTVLGWNVKDIETMIRTLNDKSVYCEKYDFLTQDDLGIWTSPNNSKVAWFKDPDGNILSLSQMP
ncbi:MAG: Glyoxalase/bleomycin resistance protein/dioxygenase [Mucilaginibacter sp.]|nr:Glyoxalase/bleomycin resistance protein/dioxygenase [Mucilaginibacter sp.]